MTALTVEQKKIQYSRQLYAYTQNQCNAVRNRMAGGKVLTKGSRTSPPSSSPETGSEEEDLRTPKPEGKGQFHTDALSLEPDLQSTFTGVGLRKRVSKAWRRR
jgi:hypothetical protein